MSQQQVYLHELEKRLKELDSLSSKTYEKLRGMRQHTTLKITDHAIVRYLERGKGMNISSMIKGLVTDDLINYYGKFGDGEFPIGKGSERVVIKDGCIVTFKK